MHESLRKYKKEEAADTHNQKLSDYDKMILQIYMVSIPTTHQVFKNSLRGAFRVFRLLIMEFLFVCYRMLKRWIGS